MLTIQKLILKAANSTQDCGPLLKQQCIKYLFTVLKKRCLTEDAYNITSMHFIEGTQRNVNKFLRMMASDAPHIFKLLCQKITKNLAKTPPPFNYVAFLLKALHECLRVGSPQMLEMDTLINVLCLSSEQSDIIIKA